MFSIVTHRLGLQLTLFCHMSFIVMVVFDMECVVLFIYLCSIYQAFLMMLCAYV